MSGSRVKVCVCVRVTCVQLLDGFGVGVARSSDERRENASYHPENPGENLRDLIENISFLQESVASFGRPEPRTAPPPQDSHRKCPGPAEQLNELQASHVVQIGHMFPRRQLHLGAQTQVPVGAEGSLLTLLHTVTSLPVVAAAAEPLDGPGHGQREVV